MQVVHKVQQRLNSDLSIAGVLITQYDGRKNLNKSVSELVQETFQGKVFSTHIRNAITLAEAPTQGQDIFHYAPKSAGAEDYEKVCNELLTFQMVKNFPGSNPLITCSFSNTYPIWLQINFVFPISVSILVCV